MSLSLESSDDISSLNGTTTFSDIWISPTIDWTPPTTLIKESFRYKGIGWFTSLSFVFEWTNPWTGNTTLNFDLPLDWNTNLIPLAWPALWDWYVADSISLLVYDNTTTKPIEWKWRIVKSWSTYTVECEFASTNVVRVFGRFMYLI